MERSQRIYSVGGLIMGLAMTMGLTGCVSLFPEQKNPPKRLFFDIDYVDAVAENPRKEAIAIVKPTASVGLSGYTLQVRYDDGELFVVDQWVGVELQDTLPSLVQRQLVKCLRDAGLFKAVGFEGDSFKRDWVLEVDIQSFDVIIATQGTDQDPPADAEGRRMKAEVVLSCKLLSNNGRAVLWQKTFGAQAPIAEHSVKGFTEGLAEAYMDVMGQIMDAF